MKLNKQNYFLISMAALMILFSACAQADEAEYRESFDSPSGSLPEGWKAVEGDFSVDDGGLLASSSKGSSYITFGEASWQNYEIEVTATFLEVDNKSRWLGVVFRAAGDGKIPHSQYTLRYECNKRNGAEFAVFTKAGDTGKPGWNIRRTAKVKKNCELGKPRKLRVRVVGSRVEIYLDDQFVLGSPLCIDRETGCLGLVASGCVVRFDDYCLRRLPNTEKLSELRPKPCDVVAHRGFSAIAPENTLSAIRAAVKAGATGCEFDVYRSKDGTVVLLHDKTVDRTTDGRGEVTELTLAELSKLDAGSWKGAKFKGEPLPTLDQALAELKDSGCIPVIEIKMEGISQKVVDAVRKADMLDQAAVIAFSANVVKEIRAIEPRLPCAWLSGKHLDGTAAEQADWIVAQAAACNTKMVDLNYNMLSAEIVAELHKRGIEVWCWTVNDPVVLDVMMRWHVDSITTDCPNLLVPLVEKAEKTHRLDR